MTTTRSKKPRKPRAAPTVVARPPDALPNPGTLLASAHAMRHDARTIIDQAEALIKVCKRLDAHHDALWTGLRYDKPAGDVRATVALIVEIDLVLHARNGTLDVTDVFHDIAGGNAAGCGGSDYSWRVVGDEHAVIVGTGAKALIDAARPFTAAAATTAATKHQTVCDSTCTDEHTAAAWNRKMVKLLTALDTAHEALRARIAQQIAKAPHNR